MKSSVAPMTIEILYYNLAQQDMAIPEPFGSDSRARWQPRSLRAVEMSSGLKSMSIDCSTSDRHSDIVIRQRDRRYELSLCCGKYLILTPKWFFAYQSLHPWLALPLPICRLGPRESCDALLIDILVFKVPNFALESIIP